MALRAAELPLREREELVDQPLEPRLGERAAVLAAEFFAKSTLAVRVETRVAAIGLQPPELRDELQATIDRSDDLRVVRSDRGPELLEPVAHVDTAAIRAAPLNTPCRMIDG